jgi:hypothetical protein
MASLTVVALAFATPLGARAQGKEDVARADSLFNAAKALLEGGQYADACGKFAESKRLAPGLGVTLYLADCYERIGRFASAWTEFRSAEGLARERNDKRADVARGRAEALEPKLDRMTISLGPTVSRSGLQVLLDGALVPPEEWGLAMAVDPGDRVVVVSGPGHSARTISVHVGPENRSPLVRIDSLDEPAVATATSAPPAASTPPAPTPTSTSPPAPEPSAPPATPEAPPSPASGSSSTLRWVGVGVMGLGVVGIGVGTAFGLSAKSKLNESNQAGNCDSTDHCSSQGLSLRHDAASAATLADVGFVVGGVALAGGIVLFLMAPHGTQNAGVWTLAPAAVAGGGGALLHTNF